jgi:hypothetical protein
LIKPYRPTVKKGLADPFALDSERGHGGDGESHKPGYRQRQAAEFVRPLFEQANMGTGGANVPISSCFLSK